MYLRRCYLSLGRDFPRAAPFGVVSSVTRPKEWADFRYNFWFADNPSGTRDQLDLIPGSPILRRNANF